MDGILNNRIIEVKKIIYKQYLLLPHIKKGGVLLFIIIIKSIGKSNTNLMVELDTEKFRKQLCSLIHKMNLFQAEDVLNTINGEAK